MQAQQPRTTLSLIPGSTYLLQFPSYVLMLRARAITQITFDYRLKEPLPRTLAKVSSILLKPFFIERTV